MFPIFLLTSCRQKEGMVVHDSVIQMSAEMMDYSSATFIQDKHIWKDGDRIILFDTGQKETADVSEPLSKGSLSSYFLFSMPLISESSTLLGVYPSDADVTVEDGSLRYKIPTDQDGSILPLQAGKVEHRKDGYKINNIIFEPLYKVLNINVGRGNRMIKSITVRADDGGLISGDIILDIGNWKQKAMSGSVTVTFDQPLSCHQGSIHVPVMVADTDVSGYMAQAYTEEGETVKADVTVGLGPEEVEYELGVSQALFGSLSQSEASSMVQVGIHHLEVTMNTFWRDQTEEECMKRFEATKKIIAATPGLEVWSVHLPFSGSLDISVSDDMKRAENVEIQRKMIALAGEFKPKKIVLHPSSEPISESDRKERLKHARESIALLLPAVRQIGAQLCIENLPRTCLGRNSEEMIELIKDFPEVMVCFDSNHLLNETHSSFFRNVGDRIGTIHASDYDMNDERHWLPGKGIIDWPLFLTSLFHYGYEGVFMTEVKSAGLEEVKAAYTNVICKTR